MKTITILVPALLLATGVGVAQTKPPAGLSVPDLPVTNAELRQAATGAAFRVGDRKYRLAPDSVVSVAGAEKTAGRSRVRVGKYAVELRGKNKRDAVSAGKKKMAAAVGNTGEAVIVTSTLNVYVTHAAALQDAVRATGGKLTYASAVGGKGRIEYASVDEAIKAMGTIQGLAGVKEASPALVQPKNSLY